LLLLQEEKDRFDAMRQIQEETKRWKQYVVLVPRFFPAPVALRHNVTWL
jgi:hypothetical protein